MGIAKRNIARTLAYSWRGTAGRLLAPRYRRELELCRSRLEGRPCLVLGSAPSPTWPAPSEKRSLLCVNSSGWAANQRGLPEPELTFMRKRKLTKAKKAHDRAAISNLTTKHLILVGGGYDPDMVTMSCYKRILEGLNYRYGTISAMDHELRAEIILEITGQEFGRGSKFDTKISNGLFSACLAFYLGATEVVLCGFSLEDGLSYVDRPHRRFHVKPNRDAILCMKTLGLPLRPRNHASPKQPGWT